jgi:hypothetical protein
MVGFTALTGGQNLGADLESPPAATSSPTTYQVSFAATAR